MVRSVQRPLGSKLVHKAAPDPLDGAETEADISADDGEVCLRLVHVRRQQPYAEVAALRDILRDLAARIEYAREQCRHILLRPVAFHPRRPIADDGIAHGVCLVEGIGGEVVDLVIDGVCRLLVHAVRHAAGDTALRVAVDKGRPLRVDDGVLFLAHGAAYHVGLSEREAREAAEYLDDLLLIDDTAVGHLQDGLEQRVLIAYALRVSGTFEKAGNGVHRTGAVEGDDGGDVLNALCLETHGHAGHAARFKLEHAGGLPCGEHGKGLRVVLRNVLDAEIRLLPPHEHRCVL